jgi:hypothetical protein
MGYDASLFLFKLPANLQLDNPAPQFIQYSQFFGKKEYIMNTKKIFVYGIAVMFALAVALAAAACFDGDYNEHKHDLGKWDIIKAATCTETGTRELRCTLDNALLTTETIPIDPDAHDWKDEWVTTAPTCTVIGIDTDTCRRKAEHTRTRDEIARLPHAIEVGEYICSVCNNPGRIGDTGPGRGKIFYVRAEGFTVQMVDPAENYTAHYLEASPVNMPDQLEWASERCSSMPIETEEAIGTGRKNTALILAAVALVPPLATIPNAPAAKACNDHGAGYKKDWFLPSKDELSEWLPANSASFDNRGLYWSSSQYDSNQAWYRYFSNFEQYDKFDHKIYFHTVRAVRAF